MALDKGRDRINEPQRPFAVNKQAEIGKELGVFRTTERFDEHRTRSHPISLRRLVEGTVHNGKLVFDVQ